MPVVTIFRSRRSLVDPSGWCAAAWVEYDFEPPAAGDHRTPAGWTHYTADPEPIRVRVPPGPLPVTAAVAIYLRAALGQDPHFRLEAETDMARRRRDDGPTLFGPDAGPAVGAYGPTRAPAIQPAPTDDPGPAPFAVAGGAIDRADELARRLEDLGRHIRRAISMLSASIADDRPALVASARAILECALEDAGLPAAGGTTEAA